MKRTRLACRYAKAFFEFALEIDQLEKVNNDIALIDTTFTSCPELRSAIISPIIRTDKKINILNAVFKQHISEITLRYFTLILRKGREHHIHIICDEFIKLYKTYKNIITLEIFSASKLESTVIESIKNKVNEYIHADIEIIEHIKPQLIGGISYKFNDYYVDATIKTQLAKLKKDFIDKSYEPNF